MKPKRMTEPEKGELIELLGKALELRELRSKVRAHFLWEDLYMPGRPLAGTSRDDLDRMGQLLKRATDAEDRLRKVEAALGDRARPRHDDDCAVVQSFGSKATCDCAEVGRKLRKRIRDLEEALTNVKKEYTSLTFHRIDPHKRQETALLMDAVVRALNLLTEKP